MKKIFCLLAVFSFAVTACVSHKNTPSIETYSLSATSAPTTTSLPKEKIIRMMPATITSEFSNSFFIYRVTNTQYLTDPYRRFLASPNAEVTDYFETRLPSSLNATLISSNNLMPANYILQENVNEFYADYQNKSAPQAVISIQFILYACKDGLTTQIGSITLYEKTAILPNNPESLLAGYEQDLDKISQQVSKFINQKIPN